MKYETRLIEIEAVEWKGSLDETEQPKWIKAAIATSSKDVGSLWVVNDKLLMKMNGQVVSIKKGDFLIKPEDGGIYPIGVTYFHKTYQKTKIQ
jgi:hypothetical protein